MVTANDRDPNAWELYDLTTDRSETENVAAQRPEVVKSLADLWTKWARDINAIPYPEDRPAAKPVPWPPRPWPTDE